MARLLMPGDSGDLVSTPDSAGLSITGDIDLRAMVALDDWFDGAVAAQVLISKWGGAGFSFSLHVNNAGSVIFQWTPDNANVETLTSTSIVAAADGEEPLWIRATLDVDNGASGHTGTFYTSHNGTTWRQLGDPIVGSGTTSIYDGTTAVVVGARSDGFTCEGAIYKAEIFEGIAGTQRASLDFTDATQGWVVGDDAGDTGTDGQSNVWTIAGTAEVIDEPSNIQDVQLFLHAALGSNPIIVAPQWIDLTSDMRGVSFTRGRQYELDRIDAGSMTVTLSNASGQYNPHNTAGAYYPNVKPMVPIRLHAYYAGVVYPLWQGFVERWPASFPSTVDAVVDVQCADLFKLLALADANISDRATVVNALNPVAWWRFADGTDEAGGDNDLTFSGSPSEGGAAGAWEDDVATTFDGTDDYATVADEADVALVGMDRSWECWVRPTATSGSDFVFRVGNATTLIVSLDWVNGSQWRVFHGGLAIVAGGYDDGEWHHVVVTHSSAGAAALYVNGILEGESSVSESAGTYEVVIGAFNSSLDGDLEFHGDISEIAVYPTVLTVDQVQALYAAQFDGYPTERTDERIAFILSDPNLGVGAEWVFTDLEEGQTTMSGVNSPTEVTALEAIQVAADTELGSFFMTGDGYARFHDRYYRLLNQSAAMDTFDSTEYRNVVLGFDDEQIYNDIAVTTSDGSDPFTARDEDSIEAYGRRSLSKSIYPDDENEGYDFAHYLKGLYAEASTRIESIDFRIGADPDLIGTILGAELGNRYNIEVALAGDDLDQDVFLEAITHNISAMKVWDVTFQLSPAVDQTFWLLGVAGSSELGETTILGY